MAYIETLAPRDWSFCTLFGYPYLEGVRNICLVFPCLSPEVHPSLSLCQRLAHLVVGVALLIPLLNTIVFIALRFFQNRVIQDVIETIDPPLTPRSLAQLTTFNTKRRAIVQELSAAHCIEPLRAELQHKLREMEQKAAVFMQHEDAPLVIEHQRMSLNKEQEMTMWDGVITYSLDDQIPSVHVDGADAMPSATFTQLGGLTQFKAQNYMCGYYALFFLLKATQQLEGEFTNRDTFNTCLDGWRKLITTKRMAVWLETHRETEIPNGLSQAGHGLSSGDMQYLIQHSESLAVLRHTPGCFMLEMDTYETPFDGEEPLLFLGKSKVDFDTLKVCPKSFPLFIIVKERDMHYYLFYARSPGQFRVVHSLNHSISNPEYFKPITFIKIIQAITGVKTPLRIKW